MKNVILRIAVLVGTLALARDFSAQMVHPQPAPAQSAAAQPAPAQPNSGQPNSGQPNSGQPSKAQPSPAQPVLKGFPFTNESLAYTVSWPSGLTLGESHLSATSNQGNWNFELTLDASLGGFAVKDTYTSSATAELCFASLSKDSVHGSKKTKETVTFDKQNAIAVRHSNYGGDEGGTTKMQVKDCARDALTFLFYTRRELGQGRVPPPEEIIFGARYNASLTYAGAETIVVNNKRIVTDKMVCHIKGPASDIQFEAYFDRDPARTPVSIRVPLPVGKLSLELVR